MNLVVEGQIRKGFSMAYGHLKEIKIDVPNAESLLAEIQASAIKAKLLPSNFVPVLVKQ